MLYFVFTFYINFIYFTWQFCFVPFSIDASHILTCHTNNHGICFFFNLTFSFFLFSSISINLTFCYFNEKAFDIREISQDQSSNFRYLFFAYFCPCHYQLGIMKYFYVCHLLLLIFVSLRKGILSVSITFTTACVYNHPQAFFAIISCLWHQFYI